MNAPLAFSVAAKRLKTITRRNTHVIQALRQIKLNKLTQGGACDTCPLSHMPQPKERFRFFRPKRFDHKLHNNDIRY